MQTRLRLGARTLDVTLVPDGDGFAATVESDAHRVVALATGPRSAVGPATVEELALEIDGRPCRAIVARLRDRMLVSIAGRVHAFDNLFVCDGAVFVLGDEARGAADAAGSGTVTAPMPGKVVSVLVAPGDTVTVGQPLVVLEAMKMESTLAADVAGTVTAVPCVAGATVAAGALLVEITPPSGSLP